MVYIIAHALYEGRDKDHKPISEKAIGKIWLYGSDMRAAHEYNRELPCMDYWMGRGIGMGVDIITTKFSAMGKYPLPVLYGDWLDTVRDIEAREYG
jgi:hypothetical protein